MTDPNYKALCAELLEWAERTSSHYYKQADVITRARAALAQPEPVVVPVAVSDALIKAECALSDVAEGEPECDDGDPAQWAEQRCAETLVMIRPVMKLHKIRTSEWPPQPMPQPEPVAPTDAELDELYFDIDAGHVASWRHYARAVLAKWGQP
jgi:hypothetical protein